MHCLEGEAIVHALTGIFSKKLRAAVYSKIPMHKDSL